MKHLYTVKLAIKFGYPGKRSWWDEPHTFHVVANGDALKAVAKAKKLATKIVIDLTDEPLWKTEDSKLIEVTRDSQIDG